MVRVNRKVEYALMALKYMSKKYSGQLSTAKEICDVVGCPFDATARVMQIMAQKGLLKSEHGAHGGYLIVKDLSKVSFADLIEMIVGPVELVKCLQEHGDCDLAGRCNIQSPIQQFNLKLVQFYRELPLAEILNVKESKPTVSASSVG